MLERAGATLWRERCRGRSEMLADGKRGKIVPLKIVKTSACCSDGLVIVAAQVPLSLAITNWRLLG